MRRIIKKLMYRFLRVLLPDLYYLEKAKVFFNGTCMETIKEYPVKLNAPFSIRDSQIGKYTYISEGAVISQTSIGRFCSIGPNLLSGWGVHPLNGISTSPMFYSTKKQNGFSLSLTDKIEERKPIVIGNDVFIGANVTILDGVTIGDGAVIGAGCMVSKDIPPYAVVAGVPMKTIRYRFDEDKIKALLENQWWNWPDEELKKVEEYFFRVDEFIRLSKIFK